MKKVVFIADKYYIKKSAIGNCIKNILPVFKQNFDVSVVTLNQDHLDTLYHLEDGVDIHLANTVILNIESRMARAKNPLNKTILKFLHFVFLVQSKLCQPRRGYNDNKKQYLKVLESFEKIDFIIPTCMPIETCAAAMEYCKCHPECKYFPLLFDIFAYNDNMYNGVPFKNKRRRMNTGIELDVIKNAERLFICNSWDTIIKEHYSPYLDKCINIEHPLISFKADHLNLGDGKTVLFAGSLLNGHNDISGFLKIFKNYKNTNNYDLHIYSNWGDRKSDTQNIFFHDWVTHEEYIDNLKNCLFVVSLSEFNGVQLCSKIFDCISYAKPVLQVVFDYNDANIEFLKKFPASLVLCVNDSLESNLKKLDSWLNTLTDLQLDTEQLKKDFIKLTPEFVANRIIEQF